MVADEIIARADGPGGLKAMSERAAAAKKEGEVAAAAKGGGRELKIPFFASA
jgi:hypothetical protein